MREEGLIRMEMLWQDLVNTDWHDYRGTGLDEDRLTKPGWIEYLLERWNMQEMEPVTAETIIAFQQLRMVIQQMIQKLLENHLPDKNDVAALNVYFTQAPSRLLLTQDGERMMLQQVPYEQNWDWVFEQVAASFARILVEHDPFRIKQCENVDCRWIYYDESRTKSRRWCEEPCANIMRVRRFRERHRQV